MNSQKQGSDADMESVDVLTVSHSFRLEWKIPSETILDNKHVPRKLSTLPHQPSSTPYDDLLNAGLSFETNTTPTTVVENSKWFEFKDLKIPPFYLELSCEKCYDDGGEMPHCRVKVVTKDHHRGAMMKLNYALVCRGDRLYRLMAGGVLMGNNDKKEQEATLDVLRGICREQKFLTVVCQVTAESDVRISSTSASSDQCANDIEKMSLMECAFPSRSFHTTSSSVEEAIDKYLASGALPSLDVGLARELLLLTASKGQAELLRALSAEFLVRNLDDGNVAGVWAYAIEHRVQSLIVECGRYMAKHWRAASSSSDSGEKAMEQLKQKNFLFSNVYCK